MIQWVRYHGDIGNPSLNSSAPGPSGEGGKPATYQVRIELANVTPVPEGQNSPSPFQVTFCMPIGNN